jgi:hypothetical protein
LLVRLALLTTACTIITELGNGHAPAVSYSGSMRSSCAPFDAPSTEIDLHSLSGPETISFNLWQGAPVTPATVIRFDASHPIGAAEFCSSGSDCEEALWGQVKLTHSDERGRVYGSWIIGLRGSRTLRGTFRADWLAVQAMCG